MGVDLASGAMNSLYSKELPPGGGGGLYGLRLSPDGRELAVVQPVSVEDRGLLRIPTSGGQAREAARFKGGRGDSLQRLAFLPDGKSVIVARAVGVDE